MFRNPNGRTLYEITLTNADGRKYLVCYASGTPSRRMMIRCLRKRWDTIEALTGVAEWTIAKGKVVVSGDWSIQYSGRTEWEAQNSHSTLTAVYE